MLSNTSRQCKNSQQYTWKLVQSYCCPHEILIFRLLNQGFWTGLCFPSLQTARNNDQFHFQSNDPWPYHSAHYIVAQSSKAWMKFKDPYFLLQLKWPDFSCSWEKGASLCSFFSEHMLNFAIFGMFSQWEVSISMQCIAITLFNTKLVMDAEPVLYVVKNACRKSWLCYNSGYCQK